MAPIRHRTGLAGGWGASLELARLSPASPLTRWAGERLNTCPALAWGPNNRCRSSGALLKTDGLGVSLKQEKARRTATRRSCNQSGSSFACSHSGLSLWRRFRRHRAIKVGPRVEFRSPFPFEAHSLEEPGAGPLGSLHCRLTPISKDGGKSGVSKVSRSCTAGLACRERLVPLTHQPATTPI